MITILDRGDVQKVEVYPAALRVKHFFIWLISLAVLAAVGPVLLDKSSRHVQVTCERDPSAPINKNDDHAGINVIGQVHCMVRESSLFGLLTRRQQEVVDTKKLQTEHRNTEGGIVWADALRGRTKVVPITPLDRGVEGPDGVLHARLTVFAEDTSQLQFSADQSFVAPGRAAVAVLACLLLLVVVATAVMSTLFPARLELQMKERVLVFRPVPGRPALTQCSFAAVRGITVTTGDTPLLRFQLKSGETHLMNNVGGFTLGELTQLAERLERLVDAPVRRDEKSRAAAAN